MPPIVGAFSCEQVDLLRHAAACRPLLALAWHGSLPDSGRQRDVIRPNRRHPMLQSVCSARPAKAPQVLSSADKSVWASAARRTLAQADRSNIHAGISSQRLASEPFRSQRKTTPSGLSIASWMPIRRPDHGCHGYSSSRNSVPWVFSSLVVQHDQASQRDRQFSPPAAYTNASVHGMQRDGTLRSLAGFATRPVAPPSLVGSDNNETLNSSP